MNNCISMGKNNTNSYHGYQDCLVPDVFHNVMSKLVQDMEYVKTYLDDLLILSKIYWYEHAQGLVSCLWNNNKFF
jgi:hypothetical protein